MSIDISVRYDGLARASNGTVTGKIELRISGNVFGQNFDEAIDARNFSFPKGGEQQVYDEKIDIKAFSGRLTATVHEHNAGQCCLQGHVHIDGPIGGGIGRDLDPNCQVIP